MNFSQLEEDDSTITSELTPSILKPLKNNVRSKNTEADAKIDQLETENLLLRRALPRLKDIDGKDVTNEFVLLSDALHQQKLDNEALQAQLNQFRKFYATSHRQHSKTVKEYEQRIESFRQEMESSRVSAVGGNAAEVLEQAKAIIAAEYETKMESLKAENVALKAENEQQAADLAEAKISDDEVKKKMEQMEQRHLNEMITKEKEMKQKDKIISGLRKLVSPRLVERTQKQKIRGKDLLIERMKVDLSDLDEDWKNNNVLRTELDKLFMKYSDGGETVSEICDLLAEERAEIDAGSASSSTNDLSNALHQTNTRELHETRESLTNIQRMIKALAGHFKKILPFLQNIEELSDNEDFHRILNHIMEITFDLDATIHDVTVAAVNGLEELQRTVAASRESLDLSRPPTRTSRENEAALQEQLRILRTKLNEEIAQKEVVRERLEAENDRLVRRVKELTDEKITLQSELEDLGENFDRMRFEDGPPGSSDAENVQMLAETLRKTRESLKTKSRDLQEARNYSEKVKEHLMAVIEEFDQLKDKKEECARMLEEKDKEIQSLVEECYKLRTGQHQAVLEDGSRVSLEQLLAQRNQLASNVQSLEKVNDKLLKKYDSLEKKFNKCASRLEEHHKYLSDICGMISKNNPESIECPENIISEPAHQQIMERIDGSSPQVCEELKYAYEKLVEIRDSESELSMASNLSGANGTIKTLDEVITELQKSFDAANGIVQELKAMCANKRKVDVHGLLHKNRHLRKSLHLAIKYFTEKKKRMEDAGVLPDVINELQRIQNVLTPDASNNKERRMGRFQ